MDSSFQLSTSSKNSVPPTLELEDVRWPILILIHIGPRARQINDKSTINPFQWVHILKFFLLIFYIHFDRGLLAAIEGEIYLKKGPLVA